MGKYITMHIRKKDVVDDFEKVYQRAFLEGLEYARTAMDRFLYRPAEAENLDYPQIGDVAEEKAAEYVDIHKPFTLHLLEAYENDTTEG